MTFDIIHSDAAPAAIGTYSQAVKTGTLVFLSGQIPLDPTTMTLVQGEVDIHIRRVFDNLSAICQAAGGSLHQIVKLNVYLLNLEHFPTVNKIMAEYFKEPYPARAAVGVAALPKGAVIEMDAIMAL